MLFKRYAAISCLLIFAVTHGQAARPKSSPIVSVSSVSVEGSTVESSTFTWRTEPHPPFGVGEDLQFVVKWGLVVAGYSSLSIPEIIDVQNRPTYYIVSTARSGGMVNAFYKVQDHNDVWLDEEALVTVRYEKRIHEGKYQIEETSLLDQPRHRWKTRSFRVDKNIYPVDLFYRKGISYRYERKDGQYLLKH